MKKVLTVALSACLLIAIQSTFAGGDHGEHHDDHHSHDSQHHTKASIAIHDPIVKITPPGITNSAGYFHIMNHSQKDIELVNVTSDIADRTEIHEHTMKNGIMKMRKVKRLNIPAKSTISFKPGGYHIMFLSVKEPIKEKQQLEFRLEFSDGSTQTIKATAQEPKISHHHDNKHEDHSDY